MIIKAPIAVMFFAALATSVLPDRYAGKVVLALSLTPIVRSFYMWQ